LRIARSLEINADTLRPLGQLTDEQRQTLLKSLTAAGYTSPANPGIGLGGESARALLAAQEGASQNIGPGGIARVIEKELVVR
jgi:hypothetical protein